MNEFRISYNPYENTTEFFEFKNNEWLEYNSPHAGLNKCKNKVIQNYADKIIERIDNALNKNGQGLKIHYCGTENDFKDFQNAVDIFNENNKKSIQVNLDKTIIESNKAINILKGCYDKLKEEFIDCVPEAHGYDELDEDLKKIGNHVYRYSEAIKSEVVACVIGNYSVGKSTFINAIIGDEYLPSDTDPATARIVRIIDDSKIELKMKCKNENSESIDIKIIWGNGKFECECIPKDGCYKYVRLIKLLIESQNDTVSQIRNFLTFINASNNVENELKKDIKFTYKDDDGLSIRDFFELNSKLDERVSLSLPFKNIKIKNPELNLVLIDTPGSNSEKHKETHTIILNEELKEQTNSIPVFLFKRDSVYNTSNAELNKNMVSAEGIDPKRGLYIISMADDSVPEECKESLPDEIIENGKDRWLYVSQLMALCSKSEIIADKKIKSKYKKNKSSFDENNYDEDTLLKLYEYAVLPAYEKKEICKQAENLKDDENSKIYVNSGFTALDYEINKFADTQALYFKVVKSREYLMEAMKLLNNKLKYDEKQLGDDITEHISKKQEKFETICDDIETVLEKYSKNNRVMFKTQVQKDLMDDFNKELELLSEEKIKNIVLAIKVAMKWKSQDEKHNQIIKDCDSKLSKIGQGIANILNRYKVDEVEKTRYQVVNIIAKDNDLTQDSKEYLEKFLKDIVIPPTMLKIDYDNFKKDGAGLKKFFFLDNTDEYVLKLCGLLRKALHKEMLNSAIDNTANNIFNSLGELQKHLLKKADDINVELKEFCEIIEEDEKKVNDIKRRIDNLQSVKCELDNLYNLEC